MINYINKDLYRYTSGKRGIFRTFLLVPSFRFIWFLRKSRSSIFLLRYIYKIFLRRYQIKYGIQISSKTKIGYGFYIGHFGNIVVSENTVLGNNCNLNQGVTIGQSSRGKYKGAPTIGNKVWIGANSVIVGKISIGDNVLIAPGAFVNRDVPSNSIVIGNPSKVINDINATKDYINRIQ